MTLTIAPVNDPPTALNDAFNTDEDVPLIADVLDNDSDVDGDALTATVETGPIHGTLDLESDGLFTYTPDANYHGPDSFTYQATDGALSDTATVTLTVASVNDPPTALNDGFNTNEDVPLIGYVLDNDSDIDGDALTATVQTEPSHGTLDLESDGLFTYTPDANYYGPDSFTYQVTDGLLLDTATVTLVIAPVTDNLVVGRYVFYAGSAHGEMIATDKEPLLPDGATATKANYTNYNLGLNGIIIDVADLGTVTELTAADFRFLVGNDNDPSGWALAPAPEPIVVQSGGGIGGVDRIVIRWADHDIEKEWLQVTMKATGNTDLPADDVFYFGNAPGEVGDSDDHALVNATDEIFARNHARGPFNPAGIDDPHDFNRDRLVNATDQIIARSNQTGPFAALQLISPPEIDGGNPAPPDVMGLEQDIATPPWSSLAELWNLEQSDRTDGSSEETDEIDQAVDRILASYWPE